MDGRVTRPLRVGLIGAGDMSRYHLAAWAKVPDAEVVAISNRTLQRADARAVEFGVPITYADAAEMLEREELDAVDIVTDRHTHAHNVTLAAEHGVDAMCQKPLAPTLREAEELVGSIDGRIRLMVHENRRWAPHFRTIRRWIDEDRVGEIRMAVMTTYRATLLPDADGRRAAVERASYFATEPRLTIGEALIHQLDVLRFLAGPLRVVAARTLRTEPEIAGETVAGILLETHPGGAPVLLAGTYVAPGLASGGMTTVGSRTSDRFELIGSRGTVLMTDERLDLRGHRPESVAVDYAGAYQTCFDEAVAHFAARLRDGGPFETDAVDNLETLRLVEDAYRFAG